jgi:hypothetical protein
VKASRIYAMHVALLVVVAPLLGCPREPQPPVPDADAMPPPFDAEPVGDGAEDDHVHAACATLFAVGCREATPDCVAVFRHAIEKRISAKLTQASAACLAISPPNVAAVRRCGIDCP